MSVYSVNLRKKTPVNVPLRGIVVAVEPHDSLMISITVQAYLQVLHSTMHGYLYSGRSIFLHETYGVL